MYWNPADPDIVGRLLLCLPLNAPPLTPLVIKGMSTVLRWYCCESSSTGLAVQY